MEEELDLLEGELELVEVELGSVEGHRPQGVESGGKGEEVGSGVGRDGVESVGG